MSRRDLILKWLAYAAAFFVGWFVVAGILSHLPVMRCVPTFLPGAIAIVAVLEGSTGGAVFGLCLGLLSCLSDVTGASMILCGTLIGMLAGLLQERPRRSEFPACFAAAAAAIAGTELVQLLLNRLAGYGSWVAVGRIALGEFLYSLAVAVPAYFLFYFVYRRSGSGK